METPLAYCGINCDICPVRIATAEGDNELRRKTAKEWSALYVDILESFGINSLKPEDMNCSGCKSEHSHFIGCAACPIKKCCQERQIGTCANCDEYDSCDMLKGFYSSTANQDAKESLDKIRMKSGITSDEEKS
ncbi:MAG TPA: DUF3795 domain-containing protein [Methanosarcina sp.]|nr:DUF3795 domain-containing protein [Methanosarcina sp.]